MEWLPGGRGGRPDPLLASGSKPPSGPPSTTCLKGNFSALTTWDHETRFHGRSLGPFPPASHKPLKTFPGCGHLHPNFRQPQSRGDTSNSPGTRGLDGAEAPRYQGHFSVTSATVCVAVSGPARPHHSSPVSPAGQRDREGGLEAPQSKETPRAGLTHAQPSTQVKPSLGGQATCTRGTEGPHGPQAHLPRQGRQAAVGLCREGKNKDPPEVALLVTAARAHELHGYHVCYL